MSHRATSSSGTSSGVTFPHDSTLAASLWAKTQPRPPDGVVPDDDDGRLWLSLVQHCRDSADVGRALAESWLPPAVTARLSRTLDAANPVAVANLLAFLAGTHDCGKATVCFQSQVATDPRTSHLWEQVRALPETPQLRTDGIHRRAHSLYSELILRRWLLLRFPGAPYSATASIAAVAGCHHGRPSGLSWQRTMTSDHQRDVAERWLDQHGGGWADMWWQILDDIAARTTSLDSIEALLQAGGLTISDQLLLAGFVSMSDWIASNQELFPLTTSGQHDAPASRADEALARLDLTRPWLPESAETLDYRARFGWSRNAELRPCQKAAMRIAAKATGPTLLVVEDETGRGKTEAAQLAGEILAERTGAGGLAFALPSMTTTDAMLPRLLAWTERLPRKDSSHSLRLMHSRATLNEDFARLMQATRHVNAGDDDPRRTTSGPENVIAHAWFGGRKGVLSEFLVCTVDQILMLALATRYVTLRHLGLAGKVVVIDEVHSYDVYTSDYLARALTWLAAQGSSVILLSATLAAAPREKLIAAYRSGLTEPRRPADGSTQQQGSAAAASLPTRPLPTKPLPRRALPTARAQTGLPQPVAGTAHPSAVDHSAPSAASPAAPFPRVTAVSASDTTAEHVPAPAQRRNVHISTIPDDMPALLAAIERLTLDGGVVGVVCNTVSRAQQAFEAISERFPGQTDLLHSQFTAADRARKETALTRALGATSSTTDGTRPQLRIVVGTQVIEQSLDIDFDALISDLAPTDSLAQRAGRMHRHSRSRPEKLRRAQLVLRGADFDSPVPSFDRGSIAVYGERVLLATTAVLYPYLGGAPWCVRHELAAAVEATYGPHVPVPAAWHAAYSAAMRTEQQRQHDAHRRARAFQLTTPADARGQMPEALRSMTALDADVHDAAAQASVRDIEPCLEVCLVQRTDESIYPLQWLLSDQDRGIALSDVAAPPRRLAQTIADSIVRLPRWLVPPERIAEAIDVLERMGFRAWQSDFRLRGQLILPLDENHCGQLLGRDFAYDPDTGIVPLTASTPIPNRGGSDDHHPC
ncbi:CRISPR-associated helicase Cas3' [Brevibacterium otitidis]|uniref:CRISPR-associated helicase Cas3 n=1 Tax=Brevibacterium otitidis TaxID=53364 RepID=A0ABV5X7A8_9MICO